MVVKIDNAKKHPFKVLQIYFIYQYSTRRNMRLVLIQIVVILRLIWQKDSSLKGVIRITINFNLVAN